MRILHIFHLKLLGYVDSIRRYHKRKQHPHAHAHTQFNKHSFGLCKRATRTRQKFKLVFEWWNFWIMRWKPIEYSLDVIDIQMQSFYLCVSLNTWIFGQWFKRWNAQLNPIKYFWILLRNEIILIVAVQNVLSQLMFKIFRIFSILWNWWWIALPDSNIYEIVVKMFNIYPLSLSSLGIQCIKLGHATDDTQICNAPMWSLRLNRLICTLK